MTTGKILKARNLLLALAAGFAPGLATARAQAPARETAPPRGGVRYPHYRDTSSGRVLDAIVTGRDATNLPGGVIQVADFKMIAVRDGQTTNVTVTALAPECRIDTSKKNGGGNVGDAGPIRIFTPTTNLYVQGVGFFLSETNEVLLISNQVETRVARSMLRSSPLFAARTNLSDDSGQVIHIFSDRGQFNFPSNLVDYAGHVRIVDPEFEMTSPLLTIQLGSNQTVETMFAREGVTLTPAGKGVATGATAHYFATNGGVLLDLAGDAAWRNGDQEAQGQKFTYQPDLHLLTGDDGVRVRWPNPRTNDSAPQTFRELAHAEHVHLQMTPDSREVDGMTATGNVIITNQADQSRATAGKAVYDRSHDSFVLTENAVWRNEQMEVHGDILSTYTNNTVSHVQGGARVKLRVSGAGPGRTGSTNQWLYVSSDDIVSAPDGPQTNLTTFRGNVHARLLDDGQLQYTLTCKILQVFQNAGHQLETVLARGDVHAETAVDATGVKKTISCALLTAHCFPATGRWRDVVAEEDVALDWFGSGAAAISNKLTAATVTAYFSPVTNQLESAAAQGSVAFFQTAPAKYIHATGDRAVYAVAPVEQVELTGHPWAETDKGTEEWSGDNPANRLKYYVKSGGVNSSGLYHLIPKPRASAAAQSAQPPP